MKGKFPARKEAGEAHQSCAESFLEGRHHCKSEFISFHLIPYSLGREASFD